MAVKNRVVESGQKMGDHEGADYLLRISNFLVDIESWGVWISCFVVNYISEYAGGS